MFYAQSTPVESLCTFQYSLVALIPCELLSRHLFGAAADPSLALLTNLDDSASPTLDERSKRITRPMTLKTSDRSSLIRYLGLPLNIFGEVCLRLSSGGTEADVANCRAPSSNLISRCSRSTS